MTPRKKASYRIFLKVIRLPFISVWITYAKVMRGVAAYVKKVRSGESSLKYIPLF